MTPQLTTLDPVTTPLSTKTILAQNGFACSLLTLAARDETPRTEANQVAEHLLFVIEGEATVRFDEGVNTILSQDEALLIPKGKAHAVAGSAHGPLKILRVDVPPRQVIEPPIFSFDR